MPDELLHYGAAPVLKRVHDVLLPDFADKDGRLQLIEAAGSLHHFGMLGDRHTAAGADGRPGVPPRVKTILAWGDTNGFATARAAFDAGAASVATMCGLGQACPHLISRALLRTAGLKPPPLLRCSACQLAVYCGVDCQTAHRPEHKEVCRLALAQSKSGPPAAVQAGAPAVSDADKLQFNRRAVMILMCAASVLAYVAHVWSVPWTTTYGAYVPPIALVIELSADARKSGFKHGHGWTVYPWQVLPHDVEHGTPVRSPQLDSLPGRGLSIHSWLQEKGIASMVKQLVYELQPGQQTAGLAQALRSKETLFVVVTTPDRHTDLTKVMLLNHHVPLDEIEAVLAGDTSWRPWALARAAWPAHADTSGGQAVYGAVQGCPLSHCDTGPGAC